jgi:hypothetical protein
LEIPIALPAAYLYGYRSPSTIVSDDCSYSRSPELSANDSTSDSINFSNLRSSASARESGGLVLCLKDAFAWLENVSEEAVVVVVMVVAVDGIVVVAPD